MTQKHPVVGFYKICTQDIESLAAFYTDVFDFKIVNRRSNYDDPAWSMDQVILHDSQNAGPSLMLMTFHNRPVTPGGQLLGIHIANLDQTIAATLAAGGQVERGPLDVPEFGIRAAFISDPQANLIEVVQHK